MIASFNSGDHTVKAAGKAVCTPGARSYFKESPNSCSCTALDGQYLPTLFDGNINGGKPYTEDFCRIKCKAHPECIAYRWWSGDGNCFTYRAKGPVAEGCALNDQIDYRFTCRMKTDFVESPDLCACSDSNDNWLPMRFDGNSDGSKPYSKEFCESKCQNDDDCVSFRWWAGDGNCFTYRLGTQPEGCALGDAIDDRFTCMRKKKYETLPSEFVESPNSCACQNADGNYLGMRFNGNADGYKPYTKEFCKAKCMNDTSCTSYRFWAGDGNCFTYSGIGIPEGCSEYSDNIDYRFSCWKKLG